ARAGLAARRRSGDPDRDRPRPAGAPGTGTGSTPASPQPRGSGRHRKGGRLMRVLVLSHRDVVAALPPRACAESMAAVLAARARGETYLPLRSLMAPPGAAGFMGLMPSWRGGQQDHGAVVAVKAICVIPDNPMRGLDAHQGTVTLFDGATGVPIAILDASAITAIRTAAVTAVATGVLAPVDARTLAILGAGVQGRAHLRAPARGRGFGQVRVYAPARAHAQALIGAGEVAGAELRAPASAQDTVGGADVVVAATNARDPVLQRAWLKPGAHVNAVGASTPRAKEIDTATVAASALFCDSRESVLAEAGEFQLAVSEGLIGGE